jgi:hypothetical protein
MPGQGNAYRSRVLGGRCQRRNLIETTSDNLHKCDGSSVIDSFLVGGEVVLSRQVSESYPVQGKQPRMPHDGIVGAQARSCVLQQLQLVLPKRPGSMGVFAMPGDHFPHCLEQPRARLCIDEAFRQRF